MCTFVGLLKEKMRKLNKILRFRFDEEIANTLSEIPRKSEYVRCAIREKMIKDNIITDKIPF